MAGPLLFNLGNIYTRMKEDIYATNVEKPYKIRLLTI